MPFGHSISQLASIKLRQKISRRANVATSVATEMSRKMPSSVSRDAQLQNSTRQPITSCLLMPVLSATSRTSRRLLKSVVIGIQSPAMIRLNLS